MIQQFIELGQGYGDVFELCELMDTNKARIHRAFLFTSQKEGKTYASLAIALQPAQESKFMPIYICREGIPYSEEKPSQRLEIFKQASEQVNQQIHYLEVKHSSNFTETTLFYQYLIGILRLNHYIPAMHAL
ncbi:methylthioribose kinase [Metasolibacillus meyeri]|uniref:Methylthioribose kinase n=1 Tax=Metasolibacillus meyeri TaxID=1071052 RepID=A0AAW9NVJ3_9BACL|nr:methylthioribose kinase [Metasolibacillus meyeri]MEC1179469.1 methylthioribose kinase [Metasolibacillus meyeri]